MKKEEDKDEKEEGEILLREQAVEGGLLKS